MSVMKAELLGTFSPTNSMEHRLLNCMRGPYMWFVICWRSSFCYMVGGSVHGHICGTFGDVHTHMHLQVQLQIICSSFIKGFHTCRVLWPVDFAVLILGVPSFCIDCLLHQWHPMLSYLLLRCRRLVGLVNDGHAEAKFVNDLRSGSVGVRVYLAHL